MARKKDNTLLWVAVLGIGGYLWWKHQEAAVNVPNSGALSVSPVQPQLSLPTSTILTSANPANGISSSSSPTTMAVNTTNLVPAIVDQHNVPILQPGQTLAVNANGSPVVNNAGVPLLFSTVQFDSINNEPYTNAAIKSQLLSGADEGECL
jgi:hypothetical protein